MHRHLAGLGVDHARDHLRGMHVQSDPAANLRHGRHSFRMVLSATAEAVTLGASHPTARHARGGCRPTFDSRPADSSIRSKPARTTCDRLRARRYQTAPSPARATQSPSAPVAPPARAPAYATGRPRRQRARSRSGTSSGCSTLQSAQCCSRCERKRRHARRDAKAARSRPHGAGRASRQQRDSSRRRPVRCRDRLPRRPPCLRLRVRAYSLPRPDPRVPHSEIGGLPGEIARDALVATNAHQVVADSWLTLWSKQ